MLVKKKYRQQYEIIQLSSKMLERMIKENKFTSACDEDHKCSASYHLH